MKLRHIVCVLFALAYTFPALFGQGVASLQGRVTDSTGAVLPGVTLTATHVDTNLHRTTITGDEGGYVLPSLPVGEYSIRAELIGFKVTELTGIILQVGQKANVDLSLQVGEISEQVRVTGEAPVLQTTNASLGQVVENRFILELPLKGRNFTDLAGFPPQSGRFRETGQSDRREMV